MHLELKSDFPVTDAACQEQTGKSMKSWFKELDALVSEGKGRREAIQWLYEAMEKNAWWSTTLWVEFERARGIVDKKDGHIEGYNICVTKTVAAAVAQVYCLLTDAKAWKQWFGDDVKASCKEGGVFEDKHGNSGEFLRLRSNKDLRFTFSHPGSSMLTRVELALAEKNGKTGITLQHLRLQNRDEADGLRVAWGLHLDQLEKLAEQS